MIDRFPRLPTGMKVASVTLELGHRKIPDKRGGDSLSSSSRLESVSSWITPWSLEGRQARRSRNHWCALISVSLGKLDFMHPPVRVCVTCGENCTQLDVIEETVVALRNVTCARDRQTDRVRTIS